MKRTIVAVSLMAVVGAATALAQVNPRGKAALDGAPVQIEYGRPGAKGRDVLSMIEPGSYWRMGADNATKLTTDVPLLVGGKRVEKGEYTLFGHFKGPDDFELVMAGGMEDGEPTDVAARVAGDISKGHEHVEEMTIVLEGKPQDAAIVLSWASSRIRMPFRVAS